MSRQNTVFVVGAGASCEFGFPAGKGLQEKISALLKPKFNDDLGIDRNVFHAFDQLRGKGLRDQEILDLCEWISDTLPLAPSIDSFLDKSSEPQDATAFLGKFAIASVISQHERQSALHRNDRDKKIDWPIFSNTWLGKLWALTNEGGLQRKIDNPLPNISFVTFNYDRCIEHFLTLAIAQSYRIPYDDALQISSNIPCEHIYGSLGQLGSEGTEQGFGGVKFSDQVIRVVSKLKTFSEQVDSEISDRIERIINSSHRIIFLGFSFGAINQKIFDAFRKEKWSLKQITGTCFEMSDQDKLRAQDWSDSCFRRSYAGSNFFDLEAVRFFDRNYLLFQKA